MLGMIEMARMFEMLSTLEILEQQQQQQQQQPAADSISQQQQAAAKPSNISLKTITSTSNIKITSTKNQCKLMKLFSLGLASVGTHSSRLAPIVDLLGQI